MTRDVEATCRVCGLSYDAYDAVVRWLNDIEADEVVCPHCGATQALRNLPNRELLAAVQETPPRLAW